LKIFKKQNYRHSRLRKSPHSLGDNRALASVLIELSAQNFAICWNAKAASLQALFSNFSQKTASNFDVFLSWFNIRFIQLQKISVAYFWGPGLDPF
jgi:hypothetical protein